MSDLNLTSEHFEKKSAVEATGAFVPFEAATLLVGLLDQYLADLQAGKAPDKAKLLAGHPELAAQLEQCLSGIEFVHMAAKPAAGVPAHLGDFRILREVGRGGMGVVYEAEQISLKRKVALKVLRFGATADPEVMKRFQREAETVAHLHHTNIVPIHAVGCEQGVNYYAMQFIEGQSLAETLAQGVREAQSSKDFRQIAGWALQAAEALAHAHQRGVIHRDIKPSNLILDPEGTVWLTDFGLAKRADEVTLTAAGVLMGTPRYMSPEQAASAKQPIDHRTDIYSLGATLYELATGKPVFDAQTPLGVITQILNTEPVSPRLIQGRMPRDLETIILKCLAKEPDKRYQQARDLADDLRSYLENRAIKARRPSLGERTLRWAKKKRGSALVAGVAAAAAIFLLLGGYFSYDAYRASQMSHLSLTTDGPGLVAEVLDGNDAVVLASFPVPTPQPVTLPAGAYRLRLSGSGQLSENWDINLERGERLEIPVKMLDRTLGSAPEIYGPDPPLLIELNGQTHVFHRSERGWRLINGATLAPVWPSDLAKYPEKPQEARYFRGRGGNLVDLLQAANFNATGSSPGLARPAIDIDGDGKDDLIIASRFSPSLLAVSGKSGKVLWWYRAGPNVPKEHALTQDPLVPQSSTEDAGVLGTPITVDIDGEPTVIAAFLSFEANLGTKSGKRLTTGTVCAIEAVAARTGKKVWRTICDLPGLVRTNWIDLGEFIDSKLEIGKLNGQETVLLAISTKVFGLDLKTGRALWPVRELDMPPIQAPQFADFDGDGNTDVIVLHQKVESSAELLLRSISLKSGAIVWERSFLCPVQNSSRKWRAAGTELAWVADLRGAGKPDVIIPVKDDWTKFTNHWIGVEVLAGATGTTRWQRPLWLAGTFSSSGVGNISIRARAGPDLNGDGHAELFVASMPMDGNYSRALDATFLQVDALSGIDGNSLWKSRRKVSRQQISWQAPGGLQWWQVGVDDWPQLVVPVAKGIGGQPNSMILAASTGRVTHLLPEIADPQVADINSDGLPDLYHLAAAQGARRLVVFKGMPPLAWRRSGAVRPGGDYNGDGIIDFLEIPLQRAGVDGRSGRDGSLLWHAEVNLAQTLLLSADVDGDAVADVVVLENYSSGTGGHCAVAAFSGKDGHRLWRGPNLGQHVFGSGASGLGPRLDHQYPLFDQIDLDGDGRPEILIAAQFSGAPLSLTALSGKDGSMLWTIPIWEAAYKGRSPIDRHLFYDLDGDGILDLVLWVPEKIDKNGVRSGYALRAFSGRDGKPLWLETPERLTQNRYLWPRPAIADLDGDGIPEVAVTTTDWDGYDREKQGFPCELVVLNGRDGKPKWRWSWVTANSPEVMPPLLVNVDGDGKRVLCMGINERLPTGMQENKIMLFEPNGTIRGSIAIDGLWDRVWGAPDIDSTGKEALLYRNKTGISAYSLTRKKDLWTKTFPGWRGMQLENPWHGPFDKPGMLALRNNQTLYVLDNKTGDTRWRGEFARQDNNQVERELVYPLNAKTRPLALSYIRGQSGTSAQRLLTTRADGHYQPAQPAPLNFSGENTLVSGDIEYRLLPWSHQEISVVGWVALLGFILPLFFWSYRGRWRRVVVFSSLALILTIGVAVLNVCLDRPHFESDERYSWDGWYMILVIGGSLGFLSMLLWKILCGVVWVGRRLFGRSGPSRV